MSVASPPPESDRAAQESSLLNAALAQIRERQYGAALDTLAPYEAQFPHGALQAEVTLARVHAMLSAAKTADALRLLDRAEMGGARVGELLVVRGELRAGVHRWAEAAGDFDRALQEQPSSALRERALYGEVWCRQGSGDVEALRKDATTYLATFPDGVRAPQVRKALGW